MIVRGKVVDGFASSGGAAGAIESRLCSAMNIPDPLAGQGDAQFLGYDQWKALYRKGVVLGVKVTFRVHNKGSVAVMFGAYALPENKANSALTSYEHIMECPGSKHKLLSPDVDNGVVVLAVNTRKHLHLRSLRDEDAFHSTLATETEPTRSFWIHTWVQPVDAATQCAYEAVLTYDFLIRLFDPILPDRSTDS